MKKKQIKKLRQVAREIYGDNLRLMWARLCCLPRRERWRLAWLLIWGNPDIERAVRR